MVKRRGIAKKPTEPPKAANDWVNAGGTDPEIALPESKAAKKSGTAKSASSDYTRANLYIPSKLHKRLKIHAAMEEMDMSEIAAEALAEWLDKHSST